MNDLLFAAICAAAIFVGYNWYRLADFILGKNP